MVGTESSADPCQEPSISLIGTANSCLGFLCSLDKYSDVYIEVFPSELNPMTFVDMMVELTTFNNPCRRKNDLQDTHERTLKLLPRAVSPQMQQTKGKFGSRPAVNFFLPIVFRIKRLKNWCSSRNKRARIQLLRQIFFRLHRTEMRERAEKLPHSVK